MTLQNNNNQSFWIQPTKLQTPVISPNLLSRSRLFSLLDQSPNATLTSLQAPAGFGKTTLVAQWLKLKQVPQGWYCFDVNDNRPEHFAHHFVRLLNQVTAGGCSATLHQLQQTDDIDLHRLLASASMELASLNSSIYLVLDEVDALKNQAVAQALTHWFKQLPCQIHIVILWQYELPFSLASFKMKGRLNALNAQQLAYSDSEAEQLLRSALAEKLPPEQCVQLNANLSAWPAAIEFTVQQLRLVATEEQARLVGQIENFELDDYLIHEVYLQQPETIQKCLVHLSVYPEFDLALAERVIGFADAQALIAEIQRRQLFIQTSLPSGQLFRFAPVFHHALERYFKKVDHQGYLMLRHQAVEVYLQQGFVTKAIELCLSLKTAEPIRQVLKHSGISLYQQGQFGQLTQLFDLLEIDFIKKDSELSVLYAWLLLATYREAHVPNLLAADKPLTEVDRDSWAEHAVAQAQAAINAEDFQLAETLANQAYQQLPPKSFVSRTGCFSVKGQLALCKGELDHAIELLTTAESLAFEHQLMPQRLWSMCLLSDAYSAKGNIEKAVSIQQTALEMASEHAIEDALHMEYLYRNRIHLRFEQGDLAAVDKLLNKSENALAPLGRYGQLNNRVHRGMLALWRKQSESALNYARQVNQLLQNHDYHTDWLAHAYEFLLACQVLGLLDFKPHFAWREKSLENQAYNHFFQHYQRVYARHLWLQGEFEPACSKLDQLISVAAHHGLHAEVLKNQIQLAVWLNTEQGKAHWLNALPSLPKAKPLQSVWLSSLFSQAKDVRDWPDWSIWFFNHQEKSPAMKEQDEHQLATVNQKYAKACDYITQKELQVFLLIGSGLSNEEISANMHIALSTVKSHIRRLYRKFGITKRSQAIQLFKHL